MVEGDSKQTPVGGPGEIANLVGMQERRKRRLAGRGLPHMHHHVGHGGDPRTIRAETGGGNLAVELQKEDGVFGDHLRRILVVLVQNPELMEVVRAVLHGQPCPTADSFYRLRSAGILAGESARDARPRCPLYTAYLQRHLL